MNNELKISKSSLDSLVFFCFGFTLNEEYEYILDRIVEKAYVDATNQGAFNTKADSRKAQLAKYGESGSKKTIIDRIMMLCKDGIVFDDWHTETCEQLVKIYDDNGLNGIFTFGNAQKWVNMSLKYIYLLNGISNYKSEEFFEKSSLICRYSSDFHVPIDSYIIDVLWGIHEVKLPFKDGVEKDRSHEYSVPSEYIKGWSNWDKEEYQQTQDMLKTVVSGKLLDWETESWIKRAKERKR